MTWLYKNVPILFFFIFALCISCSQACLQNPQCFIYDIIVCAIILATRHQAGGIFACGQFKHDNQIIQFSQ